MSYAVRHCSREVRSETPKNKIMKPASCGIGPHRGVKANPFSETGSCALTFVCVFLCLVRSKLFFRHSVHLRIFPLPSYLFWWNLGKFSVLENSRHLADMAETSTTFRNQWEERTQGQTQTQGSISLKCSKETKIKTNQLFFLLTAVNCHGTFNSLWSHKWQARCHLLCAQGLAEQGESSGVDSPAASPGPAGAAQGSTPREVRPGRRPQAAGTVSGWAGQGWQWLVK